MAKLKNYYFENGNFFEESKETDLRTSRFISIQNIFQFLDKCFIRLGKHRNVMFNDEDFRKYDSNLFFKQFFFRSSELGNKYTNKFFGFFFSTLQKVSKILNSPSVWIHYSRKFPKYFWSSLSHRSAHINLVTPHFSPIWHLVNIIRYARSSHRF